MLIETEYDRLIKFTGGHLVSKYNGSYHVVRVIPRRGHPGYYIREFGRKHQAQQFMDNIISSWLSGRKLFRQ